VQGRLKRLKGKLFDKITHDNHEKGVSLIFFSFAAWFVVLA
jgi:hypothetical protein